MCCSDRPSRMPVRPATEPTDRSMPPVRITKVMPTDTMPITTDWSSMLKTLDRVRKKGDRNDRTTAISTASSDHADFEPPRQRLGERRGRPGRGTGRRSVVDIGGRCPSRSQRRRQGVDAELDGSRGRQVAWSLRQAQADPAEVVAARALDRHQHGGAGGIGLGHEDRLALAQRLGDAGVAEDARLAGLEAGVGAPGRPRRC